MKPDFNLCDICGKKCCQKSMFIAKGREYDGVETVTIGEYIDLCEEHLQMAIVMMTGSDWDYGKKLIAWVKGNK